MQGGCIQSSHGSDSPSGARANVDVPENRPYKAENAMTAPALREGSQSPRTSTVHTAAAGMKHFNLPTPQPSHQSARACININMNICARRLDLA